MSNEKKVLIIDDDVTIVEIIDICLSKRSIDIIKSYNGEDGLEIIKECNGDIDAIVLDRQMPGLDGNQVLEEIKKGPCSSTPVMMLTGKNKVEDIMVSLKLGAEDYIVKPFDIDDFAMRIDKMLNFND